MLRTHHIQVNTNHAEPTLTEAGNSKAAPSPGDPVWPGAEVRERDRISAVLALQIPRKVSQNELLTVISKIDGVISVEEL